MEVCRIVLHTICSLITAILYRIEGYFVNHEENPWVLAWVLATLLLFLLALLAKSRFINRRIGSSTTQTVTRPVIWGNQGNGQPRQWSLISIAHGAQRVLGISLFERPPITYNYHAGTDSRNNPFRRVLWLCFNGGENIFNLLANVREVMNRAARRPALLHSQEDCAIFGEDLTSRQEFYVTGLVIMFHEKNSEGSVVMPGQDTSPVILNRRVNVIGLVVNLRVNRYRAERAAVLLHFQEGRVLPDMCSVISFTRRADTYGVLGMLREVANMATISPTLVHSPEICAPPMQDMSSVISFNQGVDVFGTLVVLREITNMASIWPTLQREQIYAGLGRNIASIVLFERRVYVTDRVGLFRELANGAFRASDLFHCQKRCALLGKDILGSSRKNRVTRHCYSKSLSSNSGHSLSIDQPERFCRGDLDRKASESKIALIDKGPINPLDIQSGVNGQNKDNTQELALVKDALEGNLGGMERIVAQRGAGVLPDFDNCALVCGCIEHERIAIKNVHKNGQSNNGDENCYLDNRAKNLSDGCLVSDSEDEDYSWLGDKESQNNSTKDIESDYDWTYGSDSENDSEYQSDDESDLDQAEEDYFMELLQGNGQNHPVNQPQYDLMPHWLPGYILDAHAVMNAQGHQPNPGPPEEAPAGAHPHHLPQDAQDQPQAVNENGDVQNEPNGEGHEEGPPNGPQIPAMAQPVLPQGGHHPQQGNQPQQQAQATGPLNRLRAAARYVKRKLTRQNNPVPMYVPGAPREERTPIGLEEAPALVGVPMIPHDDGDEMGEEAQPRGLFACFTSLFRRHGNPVEEYALQAEQVQEFEEQIPIVEPEMDVLEDDMQVVEELVEGAEPQANALAVEAF